MSEFVHQRHKPPTPPTSLSRTSELIVACPPMRSNVNLSRIVRTAACCGVRRLIACGQVSIDPKIARDALDVLKVETHRTLEPILKQLKSEGLALVGLEQTTGSKNLHTFNFPRPSVLVLGNERKGLGDEVLRLLDHVVEIPVYGLPHSHNVATAAAMAMYEYCRQHCEG